MAVVPIRRILDPAFAERYGVAAINVVDDLTLEAVLAAATELDSPLIVQTSLKTVKSIGAKALYSMWRARADEVPVPVSLHLDHCPDREWISICLRGRMELGPVRRLPPRRRREHPPDDRGRRRGRALRRAGRGRDRERARRRGRRRLRRGRRGASGRGVRAVHRGDRRVLVRAGDRHRARPVQEPRPSSSPSASPSWSSCTRSRWSCTAAPDSPRRSSPI